jgi:putative spermidine/putrescine transport system substrate-binding protein/spermidine/putrescine transport system substrate-binding protein
MRIFWNLLPAVFLVSCMSTCVGDNKSETKAEYPLAKYKGATLNILSWEGYADEEFTKGFEDKYGVAVKGTYFGSSDELMSKLQNGGCAAYDIISPSSDVASTLIEMDLVEPIDPGKISQWHNLSTLLRNMTDVSKDGKVYGMPFTWGPDYLVYNADVVKEEPTSWKVLWDPAYKGKVSVWDDISNIYLMGQILGYDKTDKAALYNMTPEQLEACKKKLSTLKPQLRKYWATAGELDNLMKNKEVVLAVGWPLTSATLNKGGMNIKTTIPKEGSTGWIDRLMVVKGSKNAELAQLYLDYISQPENMAKVAEVTNYSIANPGAAAYMSRELQEVTHVNNMGYFHERLNFWQPVKERARYNQVWNEVKSR